MSQPDLVRAAGALCAIAVLSFSPLQSLGAQQPEQPPELGAVRWLRSEADAQQKAKASGKPLLILFQEVPGWSTCKVFGAQVLSHPLVVEAAETLFTPLCIYNNTEGDADAAARQAYGERSWNNPVVRVVDHKRQNRTKALTRDWSVRGISNLMVRALQADEREVPPWLSLLAKTSGVPKARTESAIFGMSWFWEGEAEFGLLDGVLATESFWFGRKEGVRVTYDREQVSFAKLLEVAGTKKCDLFVWTTTTAQLAAAKKLVGDRAQPYAKMKAKSAPRLDKEQQYYLGKSELVHLPMTRTQATRVNAAIARKGVPMATLLSPRQLAWYEQIRSASESRQLPSALGVPMKDAASALVDALAREKR